jgi:hypothetical protein
VSCKCLKVLLCSDLFFLYYCKAHLPVKCCRDDLAHLPLFTMFSETVLQPCLIGCLRKFASLFAHIIRANSVMGKVILACFVSSNG